MKKFEAPIYVNKPFLPPLEDFVEDLKDIWESKWLTNEGPQLKKFESMLSDFFQSDNICLFSNGTLALQIGLQGMGISGEVITTPFSFVATTHSLYWNKIRPVFCDIESDYFTLDPERVEELITPWTTAILAVHVFGHPCRLNALADIARRHNLALIYDAAHAFGVKVNGKTIGHFGDLSMFSFHATKLYHTFEGGMLTFSDPGIGQVFNYLKNFGFKNEVEVVMPGTNAKMNELQALMGLKMLEYLERIIARRCRIYMTYQERLDSVTGIAFSPDFAQNIQYNYAYVPVLVDGHEFGIGRDELYESLKEYNVFTRRYFYPLICDYACYKSVPIPRPLKISSKVANQILTLPIYAELSEDDVHKICDIIIEIKNKKTK